MHGKHCILLEELVCCSTVYNFNVSALWKLFISMTGAYTENGNFIITACKLMRKRGPTHLESVMKWPFCHYSYRVWNGGKYDWHCDPKLLTQKAGELRHV